MPAVALLIRRTDDGWGVYLTDGQELTRYRGPWAKMLALRYLRRYSRSVAPSRRLTGGWWHGQAPRQ